MPTRSEKWPHGTPSWVDYSAPDVDAAKEFYAAVLGWTFEGGDDPQYGGYMMAKVADHDAAGVGPQQQPGVPPAWVTYFATDDADASAEAVQAAGGTVVAEPFDVGPLGRMAIAVDNQGAAFGVWQAKEHIGASVYNEPGSLVWSEAAVPDPDAARQFYTQVFGFTHESTEGAGEEYRTFATSGDPLGGIGGLETEGVPPHWMTYFAVADADATVAAAQQMGATVRGPVDTAYGKMATITDPAGAVFAIMAVGPAATT